MREWLYFRHGMSESRIIEETSLEKMLEIAAAAIDRRRQERASEPPKWVIPDDF